MTTTMQPVSLVGLPNLSNSKHWSEKKKVHHCSAQRSSCFVNNYFQQIIDKKQTWLSRNQNCRNVEISFCRRDKACLEKVEKSKKKMLDASFDNRSSQWQPMAARVKTERGFSGTSRGLTAEMRCEWRDPGIPLAVGADVQAGRRAWHGGLRAHARLASRRLGPREPTRPRQRAAPSPRCAFFSHGHRSSLRDFPSRGCVFGRPEDVSTSREIVLVSCVCAPASLVTF